MSIDTRDFQAIVRFISRQYKDDDAGKKLELFMQAYKDGWADATTNSAEYVAQWAEPMHSLHESSTKSLLLEVADGIAHL